MAISFELSKTGKVETQDFNVKVQKTVPKPASLERFGKIAVIATKPDSQGEDATGLLVVANQDTTKVIKEQSEVKNFAGSFFLWNLTHTALKDKLPDIKGMVKTVILLSGTSNDNFMNLDWGDLAVFATETNSPTQLDQWCKTALRGAFLDTQKEGAALYIISKMLEISRNVLNPMRIDGGIFSGITDTSVAAQLDDAGFSFFVRCTNGSFAKSVWLGGNQAYAIFNDFIVEYDVKEVLNQFILAGAVIDDNSLKDIETRVISQLQLNVSQGNIREIKSVSFPDVSSLSAEQRRRGEVGKVTIEYFLENVLRTVIIELAGDN